MTYLLLIPIFAVLNRLRGMDTPKWLPVSLRIVAALLGSLAWWYFLPVCDTDNPIPKCDLQRGNIYSALIVLFGWFLWAVPAWYPRDNWSASAPIDNFAKWYIITCSRQLVCLPLFVGLAMLYNNYVIVLCSIPIVFGWGWVYYSLSPNRFNLKHHTEWAELVVGLLWGMALCLTISIK